LDFPQPGNPKTSPKSVRSSANPSKMREAIQVQNM
jgi:hypothetical protein